VTEPVRVGIVVGSESDLPVMNTCGEVLDGYGIGWEIGVMSAHRAGDVVRAYALAAPERGLRVLIAGAGAAGIPVATVAVGPMGARNAGHLAAEIIGLFDPEVAARIKEERARMRSKVQLPEGFDFQ
jgi:phosphoribosylcarboxyaminoimidazole (NCAIR) mutase